MRQSYSKPKVGRFLRHGVVSVSCVGFQLKAKFNYASWFEAGRLRTSFDTNQIA